MSKSPKNANNNLKITLYHGTSSRFLDSIKRFGLNGHRDEELFCWQTLEALDGALAKPENFSKDWDDLEPFVRKIFKYRDSHDHNHWSYGDTYLTPSLNKAIHYATHMEGSEFLSFMKTAYEGLLSVNPEAAESIIPAGSALATFFSAPHQPWVIEVDSVPVDFLLTEYGRDPTEQIEHLEQTLKKARAEGFNMETFTAIACQAANFRLTCALSPEQLVFRQVSDS